MTMAARGRGTAGAAAAADSARKAGAPRTPEQPGQAAEVSWFDTREVTLSRADLAGLDATEAARAAAFVFPADRHRYQVAHVMLRRVLARRLGTEPGRLTFGRQPCPACGGPSGRPALAGPRAEGEPGLSFSLAHSGEAVAIAVAGIPVGIDVERQPAGCVCSLTPAMHADDAARVATLPEPDRHLAVMRWWVRAEALLKCAGTGIAHGMDAVPVLGATERSVLVQVAPVPGAPARGGVPGPRPPAAPGSSGRAAAAGYFVTALSAPEGYQAALALPGPGRISYRQGAGGWYPGSPRPWRRAGAR
jgi:4'-phosphopantetheinyl transferase